MHYLSRVDYTAAEGLSNRLVAEADPENGNFSGKSGDSLNRDACLVRCAWSGTDNQIIGAPPLDLLQRDFVISEYMNLLSQFTKILHQVVGE